MILFACAFIIFMSLLIIYMVGKELMMNEKNIHAVRYYIKRFRLSDLIHGKKKINKNPRLSSRKIPVNFAKYAKQIGNCIDEEIKRYQNTRFMPIMHDAVKGGKRIRGSILISVAGESVEAIKLASCIELIHCSSLVFDDIMDGDIYRRDEKSVYYKYGVSDAIMAGMLLLSSVSNILHDVKPVYSEKILRAGRTLVSGQMRDLNASDDIAQLIDEKTSVLFRLAFELGYDLRTDSDEDLRDKVIKAGNDLGTGFQIADDFDDIAQDAADANGAKKNYVLKYGAVAAQNKLDDIYSNCIDTFAESGILNDDIKSMLEMICLPAQRA